MIRRNMVLLPLLFAVPSMAEPAPKPGSTCSPDWLDEHGSFTVEVYKGQIADPEALIEHVASAVKKAGGSIGKRRAVNDTFELHARLGGELNVQALIQARRPVWEHREKTEKEMRVGRRCKQLEAINAVNARLIAWMAEDLSPHEEQMVTELHKNHQKEVMQILRDLDSYTSRSVTRQVEVTFSKIGSTVAGRRR